VTRSSMQELHLKERLRDISSLVEAEEPRAVH